MAFRKFTDRNGNEWEVRPRSRSEWSLEPCASNPERPRTVAAPGYEKDPFELSREELQRLLDASQAPGARAVRNPFKD